MGRRKGISIDATESIKTLQAFSKRGIRNATISRSSGISETAIGKLVNQRVTTINEGMAEAISKLTYEQLRTIQIKARTQRVRKPHKYTKPNIEKHLASSTDSDSAIKAPPITQIPPASIGSLPHQIAPSTDSSPPDILTIHPTPPPHIQYHATRISPIDSTANKLSPQAQSIPTTCSILTTDQCQSATDIITYLTDHHVSLRDISDIIGTTCGNLLSVKHGNQSNYALCREIEEHRAELETLLY